MGRGRKPLLSSEHQLAVAQRQEAEPQEGDVCSPRGLDFQQFIEDLFGKRMSLSTVYGLLHELGYEWLVPRFKHRKSDHEAITAFKNVPATIAKIQAEHPSQQVVAFFPDECRFGQQGTLTPVWVTPWFAADRGVSDEWHLDIANTPERLTFDFVPGFHQAVVVFGPAF